jgi:DNA sulfur modification protein DndB
VNETFIIHNEGPYFYGDLVTNKGLNKVANQLLSKKEKPVDELLEDKVWLLFKDMGFKEMNMDRNFKICAGAIQKQIDVFAKEGNNVFIVECKAQNEKGAKPLRKDIHEILNLRKDIIKSVCNYYECKVRVTFLLVTSNIIWSKEDERFALDAKKHNFLFWMDEELDAYINLVKQLGESARFQFYSLAFYGKKAYELEDITVPAIYGGKGKKKYYIFIIQPEKLLKIVYVHRREESNPKEVAETYQRMASKKRIDKICEFVNKGGFFPNNIIINFTKQPQFDKKAEVGDIVYGILKFPPYYGSAWVIDGQHRLYGYSNSEKKFTDTIPVVAFNLLSVKDQANLFVEINREQKKVSSNLLWELYSYIYQGSEDEKQNILRTISLIAKKINFDTTSVFYGRIRIPSALVVDKEKTNLTLANICDAIKDNKLVERKENLLYNENYDQTVNIASEVIKAFFDVVASSFKEDWDKGEKGLLRTNIGVRIFFILLRQLLRYLNYNNQQHVYKTRDLTKFKDETSRLLKPVIEKLKKMDDEQVNKIRRETGKGPIMNNAQQMAWWIKEAVDETFGKEILSRWAPPMPKEETDDKIRKLLEQTEISLREFLMKELKKIYGNLWYRQGIPGGVKNGIDEKIEKQIEKEPWRKEELSNLPIERRLTFSDTPHLREIIIYSDNWEHFKSIFIPDKEITTTRFKDFEFIRNKYQHFAEDECDTISKNLGYWGMRWIRKCIGLDKAEK